MRDTRRSGTGADWRAELKPTDRANTRRRFASGFHQHCDGDFEKLLLLVASMEEQVVHIRSQSKSAYVDAAVALGDRIERFPT